MEGERSLQLVMIVCADAREWTINFTSKASSLSQGPQLRDQQRNTEQEDSDQPQLLYTMTFH